MEVGLMQRRQIGLSYDRQMWRNLETINRTEISHRRYRFWMGRLLSRCDSDILSCSRPIHLGRSRSNAEFRQLIFLRALQRGMCPVVLSVQIRSRPVPVCVPPLYNMENSIWLIHNLMWIRFITRNYNFRTESKINLSSRKSKVNQSKENK